MNARHSTAFIGFLMILSISGPLAINFYLALLPNMAESLLSNATTLQRTVSVYLIGFSIAQLLIGPLSDRFGRKIVLIACYVIFFISSLMCALATDATFLIIARFVQALGGSAGVLISRVIVKDIYPPEEMGKIMSNMATAFSIAPLVAPMIGSFVGVALGWRSLFIILAVFSLIIIAWTLLIYQESNKNLNPNAVRAKHLIGNYSTLLKNPNYLGYLLIVCTSVAGILTYTSASSFVLIDLLSVSPTTYGWLFSVSALGMLIGSLISARLNTRIGGTSTVWYGAIILVLGGVMMALLPLLGIFSVLSIVGPMFIYALGNGIVMPTAMSLAIMPFPKMAGAAAALIGSFQTALGALCGYIVSIFYDVSAIPMTTMIGFMSIVAFTNVLLLKFRYRKNLEAV